MLRARYAQVAALLRICRPNLLASYSGARFAMSPTDYGKGLRGGLPRGPVSRILYPGGPGRWSSIWSSRCRKESCGLPGDAVERRPPKNRRHPSIWPCSGRGLPASRLAPEPGALLPHRFTLACGQSKLRPIGGVVSVALSVASRRLGVTQPPARWSPDFPLQSKPERPPGPLGSPSIPPRGPPPHAPGLFPRRTRGGGGAMEQRLTGATPW